MHFPPLDTLISKNVIFHWMPSGTPRLEPSWARAYLLSATGAYSLCSFTTFFDILAKANTIKLEGDRLSFSLQLYTNYTFL